MSDQFVAQESPAPASLEEALGGVDHIAGLDESGRPVTEVAPLGLSDLGEGTGQMAPDRDLRLLADIQLELSVELGRSRLPLRDLLSLAPGAVLELDRTAGEPVDVLVNGKVVARGEVVVVDGDFGVRINEIADRD
jgi:flagellar motor switch protein FliN